MNTDVDETLQRISSRRGVHGVLILARDGTPIRSTLTRDQTRIYAIQLTGLVRKARDTVRDLEGNMDEKRQDADEEVASKETIPVKDVNELTFLRVRTKKNEIMIAPDKEYTLVVIQNPSEHAA